MGNLYPAVEKIKKYLKLKTNQNSNWVENKICQEFFGGTPAEIAGEKGLVCFSAKSPTKASFPTLRLSVVLGEVSHEMHVW